MYFTSQLQFLLCKRPQLLEDFVPRPLPGLHPWTQWGISIPDALSVESKKILKLSYDGS